MGVIYKLKAEIINFILEQKKANSALSCRGITSLIQEKFQVKVSKSSINAIIKQEGLSMPVGRRQKKKRGRRRPLIDTSLHEAIKLLAGPPKPTTAPISPAPAVVAPAPEINPLVPPPAEISPPSPKVEEPLIVEIKAEQLEQGESTGAVLLMAADYLIGGSYYFTDAVRGRLGVPDPSIALKTESLIYMHLNAQMDTVQSPLSAKSFSIEGLKSYLVALQDVKLIYTDLFRIITNILREVRCIKVNLSDGSILYLDGQLHTIWSTPHIPHDFATTIYDIKSYVNGCFYKDHPFVFFMAPGYDAPTKEFFNLLLGLESKSKQITKLTLYDNSFEELETINLNLNKRQLFCFGVWPWQFVEFRKVKKIGEFKPFYAQALGKEIYAAEIGIELTQPYVNQQVTLIGSALKTSPADKTRLILLTNLIDEARQPAEWLNLYLSRWPNFEEGFHDYSRKIELFTYTGTSRRFFSTEIAGWDRQSMPDINSVFKKYLEALDLYARWHFLPSGYENKDFSTIKERFYNLKTGLKKENGKLLVTFKPPQSFQFLKDLEYACHRLNEREILTPEKIRIRFSV